MVEFPFWLWDASQGNSVAFVIPLVIPLLIAGGGVIAGAAKLFPQLAQLRTSRAVAQIREQTRRDGVRAQGGRPLSPAQLAQIDRDLSGIQAEQAKEREKDKEKDPLGRVLGLLPYALILVAGFLVVRGAEVFKSKPRR